MYPCLHGGTWSYTGLVTGYPGYPTVSRGPLCPMQEQRLLIQVGLKEPVLVRISAKIGPWAERAA